MTEKHPYIVMTFPSVHYAIKFESVLKNTNLSFTLIPVPREISASCGVAAKVYSNLNLILKSLQEHKLQYDCIYNYTPGAKPIKVLGEV